MTTYRLMDGASGRPGVGSSGTQPPSSPTAYSGNYIAGLVFGTTGTAWMTGYYWWVPPGGDTGAVKCALWQQRGPAGPAQGTLVPGSVVTSGTLTAGAWNFIALASPLPLANAAGVTYVAALGYHTTIGFPDTQNQFNTSQPYASGITNGPLTAPASSGTYGPQQPFSVAGSDPSVTMPTTNDLDDLLWLDVQVTDTPPAGATYRLWPSYPYAIGDGSNGGVSVDTDGYTMSVQFSLSEACSLNKIWFYSAPAKFSGAAAAALPTRATLWDTVTQLPVSGGDINGVTWHNPDGSTASAGAGWVYADFSGAGVTLSASHNYKASVWYAGGSTWRTVVDVYWSGGGAGAGGITQGPLTAPNTAGATPGQDSWHGPNLAWAYPNTYSNPENDWVDVEVAPASSFSGTGSAALSLGASGPGSAAKAGSGHAAVALGAAAPGASARSGPGAAAVSLGASSSGTSERSGPGSAVLSLRALASGGSSHRSGTGIAALRLAALGTAPAPAAAASTGSWWGLDTVLKESRAEFDAYWGRPPLDCPFCGEPLTPGPGTAAGSSVELFCRYGGDHEFVYPRDWRPEVRFDSGGLVSPL